jgi:hypothetical protein
MRAGRSVAVPIACQPGHDDGQTADGMGTAHDNLL